MGATGEARFNFFYSDGTDANSTSVSVSQGLFTEFINYVNPSPRQFKKLVTWLRPTGGGTVWERRLKKRALCRIYSNFDRKHASYDAQMVKRNEFPQAVLTDGVMNQIRKAEYLEWVGTI